MDDGTRTLFKNCEQSPLPIANKNCDRPGSQPGALPAELRPPQFLIVSRLKPLPQTGSCKELGWTMGLEPTTTGITTRGSTS